jgi:hypothetical protein
MQKAKLKYIFCTIVFWATCFSTIATQAQSSSDEQDEMRSFFGGLLLGGNISQVSGDGIEGYHKLGYNGGVMTYFKLAENIAGSLELLLTEKGSNYIKGVDPALANLGAKVYKKYCIKLPYAEIPLIINYFDQRNSNLGIGVSYGQLFNEKEILDSADLAKTFPFRKYDVSLLLNGNLMVDKHWGVNIRFAYSLLNIRTKHNIDLLQREEQFSRLFSIRAFYLF